jgi:hypothetical protein
MALAAPIIGKRLRLAHAAIRIPIASRETTARTRNIPAEFSHLSCLETLYLKKNNLSGKSYEILDFNNRIIEETNENFRITKPLTLVPSREGLGMTQSMFSATFDKDARLNKTAIVIGPSETRKDIADSYIEGTTGIKTVTKPSIITG